MTDAAHVGLTRTVRAEWPRLVAAALRIVGDLQTAEDVVQDTFVVALDRWPVAGVPGRPGAWLLTACRNRALNVVRDAARANRRLHAAEPLLDGSSPVGEPAGEPVWEPGIPDDRLRLIVMCCHPVLPTDAQVALTLRMVSGLTTDEIARGFHLPPATIAQRLVRAKRALAEHRIAFATDEPDLATRLPAVLDVVYLVFNEGYLPSAGGSVTRDDLTHEAYRLAGLLTRLVPGEPDVWALRALIAFQLSRWSTRADARGDLVPLEAQDRGLWDQDLITEGRSALQRVRATGARTPLVLQAEIAARHASARSFAETDWAAVVRLYDELATRLDSAVVALNRAVAVAMALGPEAALPILDRLVEDAALRTGHRVWSVRADLLRRAGETTKAIADYDRALQLVRNETERRYLAQARARLAGTSATAAGSGPRMDTEKRG